jgi:hypothetical protein
MHLPQRENHFRKCKCTFRSAEAIPMDNGDGQWTISLRVKDKIAYFCALTD